MAEVKKMICAGRNICGSEVCDHSVMHEKKPNCLSSCQRSGKRCKSSPVIDYIDEIFGG